MTTSKLPSSFNAPLSETDPEIAAVLQGELDRQRNFLEMIASENFVSRGVLEAQGSVLTNKYAEGYPGKRYYGGCEFVDVAEQLAIDRVKALFGAEAANVQPHCGASANQAVFLAFLKPGDTFMGMSLAEGGHLTHGMALNMSGKWFNPIAYGLDKNEEIDYEQMEKLAREHKPKLIIAGASAYSKKIDFERIGRLAKEVGAIFMVDMAHYAGLVAAGVYPNPVPHADIVTSTTHKSLRGPRGGIILMKAEHEKAINSAVFPGLQGGPLMHVIAAKAVAFKEAAEPGFKEYQKQVVANAKALAETLNKLGAKCKAAGLELLYHNHDFEFTQFGDTNGYEILLNETDPKLVDFELDLYWAVRAGHNPLDLFKQHPGRFTMWHVKDMDKANKELNAEIGKGAIDFKAIFD